MWWTWPPSLPVRHLWPSHSAHARPHDAHLPRCLAMTLWRMASYSGSRYPLR